MKHTLLYIYMVLALILSACASSKKASSSVKAEADIDSVANDESVKKNSFLDFDTSFIKNLGVTITEVEFYPSSFVIDSIPNANAMQMQCKCNANASPRSPTHGGIKRLKQTNIGVNVKAESHTKQGDSLSVNKSNAAKRKHDANAIKEQTTGKRSFHWWYYVIIVGAIALLYLARMPILNFIHKILTGLRRIS